MNLKWHLFLRLSIGFFLKKVLWENIQTFITKRCLFIFCIFYLKEKELIQQKCPRKYIENEILIVPHTKQENKRARAKI